MVTTNPLALRPHERVARLLRERIRCGHWHAGQMIPGRQQLAKQHGVALGTVERAVTTLITEGLLHAADRRGTFVTDRPSASIPHPGEPPKVASAICSV